MPPPLPSSLPPISTLSLHPSSNQPPPQPSRLPPPSQPPPAARPRTPLNGTRLSEAELRRQRVEEQCGHLRLCSDSQTPAFELLVLGCGGGPIETNLSSFLVKPYSGKWTDGCTGIEGGSTIGALSSLIERNPYAFEGFGLEIGVDANELEAAADLTQGEQTLIGVGREGGGKAAAKVWDLISCFAITHAHLDHIAGLIISSAACRPPPKPVYGIKRTIENIEKLMDGGVWPMLGGWDDSVTIGRAYHYKHIPTPTPAPLPLSPHLSFHAFPLSHGLDPSAFRRKREAESSSSPAPSLNGHAHSNKPCNECYDSTAFFVKEEQTGKELLFFGDVEPDSISKRGLNLAVWKVAAPKIAAGKLSVMFLECSYPSSQPASLLFGHFSPPYILEEMVILASLVTEERVRAGLDRKLAEKDPLDGVIVVIQHIKDDIFALPKPAASSSSPAPPTPSSNAKHGSTPSVNSDKDLPPVPPPKDDSLTPTSHSRQPSTSSIASQASASTSSPRKSSIPSRNPPRRPDNLAPSTAVSRSSAAADHAGSAPNPPLRSSGANSSDPMLLSMGPPVPSAPTRRPSVATGGFAFPSSPLATALSRNSYRMTVHDGSPSSGGSLGPPFPGAVAPGGGWQHSFAFADAAAARRASTPAPFGFFPGGVMGNPFAQHSPGGRLALPQQAGGAYSAPPSSASSLSPGFESDHPGGGVSPGTRVGRGGMNFGGTSPGRSPNRSSSYAFPVTRSVASVDEREEEEESHEDQAQGATPEPVRTADEGVQEEEEEDTVEETVHERIERELNELEEKERTGVKFLIAVQGMRLVF
ncbi:hypothetical protein JCM11251_003477 [Rhodosporidiobolus azoricus]